MYVLLECASRGQNKTILRLILLMEVVFDMTGIHCTLSVVVVSSRLPRVPAICSSVCVVTTSTPQRSGPTPPVCSVDSTCALPCSTTNLFSTRSSLTSPASTAPVASQPNNTTWVPFLVREDSTSAMYQFSFATDPHPLAVNIFMKVNSTCLDFYSIQLMSAAVDECHYVTTSACYLFTGFIHIHCDKII